MDNILGYGVVRDTLIIYFIQPKAFTHQAQCKKRGNNHIVLLLSTNFHDITWIVTCDRT